MDQFQQIDAALSDALQQLGSAKRRKAMREIAQYLRRQNRFRIRAQRNPDGSGYAPRKKVTSPGGMKTATFDYNGSTHKVFVVRQTSNAMLGFYVRAYSGTNYRWFSKEKMSGIKYGRLKPKGKMLIGFTKRMAAEWNIDRAVISLDGKVAQIHHHGQTKRGITYPSRKLLGLPEEDKQEVLAILLRNLTVD